MFVENQRLIKTHHNQSNRSGPQRLQQLSTMEAQSI
jgi:hypothetical protein